MTWAQLSEAVGIKPAVLIGLSTGSISPFKENGEMRKGIQSLIEYLDVEFEDVFPRYFCRLNKAEESMCNLELVISEHTLRAAIDPEQHLINAEYVDQLKKLDDLKPRSFEVLKLRLNGYNYEDIGYKYNVTNTTVHVELHKMLERSNILPEEAHSRLSTVVEKRKKEEERKQREERKSEERLRKLRINW
jgi:hypothetical protein